MVKAALINKGCQPKPKKSQSISSTVESSSREACAFWLGAYVLLDFGYNHLCIKTRPDGLTNLPPGKVDAKADAAPVGATNREMRRPSLDTLEGFFYV
jgi:hypothetical protein